MQTITREITEAVVLCDAAGRLNPEARGWARKPLFRCNLKGRFLRKKRWDYWCIIGERAAFSATLANIDYAGLAAAYLLEYETKRFAMASGFRPFSQTPVMPEDFDGAMDFQQNGLHAHFDSEATHVRMTLSAAQFGGKTLEAVFDIERPPEHETLNVVVPWNERTFQFTSKQNCLPAEGKVVWGDEVFEFSRDRSFAVLDYGRGIWPYQTTWNWGAFSARVGADTVGLTMGAQWTDGTGMNENGIVLNGRLHKIFDDIVFSYDRSDFMAPWTIRTATTDEVDLRLEPFFDNQSGANLLVLSAHGHQMFGRYSGTLRVAGRTIPIQNVVGWAEEHISRW